MNTDLISIIENVSRSMAGVQTLFTGLAYILGICFFISAIIKLRKIADKKGYNSSGGNMFVPTAHFLMGVGLLFLPSIIPVMANTVFGVNNVLQYSDYTPTNYMSSLIFIIRSVGVIWFIRGCSLLAHASQPGVQLGAKGMMFLIAGIFAINFESTVAGINTLMTNLFSFMANL